MPTRRRSGGRDARGAATRRGGGGGDAPRPRRARSRRRRRTAPRPTAPRASRPRRGGASAPPRRTPRERATPGRDARGPAGCTAGASPASRARAERVDADVDADAGASRRDARSDIEGRGGATRRVRARGRRRGWVLVNAGDGWSGIIIGAERASGLTEDPGQKSRSPMRHEIVHRRAPVKTSRRQERDCLRCCCFSGLSGRVR